MLIANKQVLGFGLFGGYGVQIVVDAAAANAALPGLRQSGQYLLRLKVRKIQVLGQLLNRLRRGISFYTDGKLPPVSAETTSDSAWLLVMPRSSCKRLRSPK